MLDTDNTDTYSKAADLHSLLRCAMVAEENETSGLDWKGLERVLEMGVRMAAELMDDVEKLEQKAKGGEN
ncbi:hypothetical protein KPG71_19075 [Roseovarius sp. PS-C2]|uniref:hypothetical protein n=1 Tax=Roseovarius sp. PS-C2 TaxID=2820814 RepID=UPI001C0BCF47|nr:hypothetical protein [Roseovarius sp. PS-C2]MBU3262130.1 hypothetical protein [Roseovarius sp. PS-C2]